jgi:hypothetical protein
MRMAGASRQIDEKEFVRLWFSESSLAEICETLGITGGSLWHLQNKHGLPARGRPRDTQRRPDDPTPEEIEERAAECRKKRTKEEQARNAQIGRVAYEIPAFAFNGRDASFRRMNS